jgi:hypothetical protein
MGLGVWKYIQPCVAHLYILIYMVYEQLRESLKRIIRYIYIMIGIIINLIRYIFMYGIRSLYTYHSTKNKENKT